MIVISSELVLSPVTEQSVGGVALTANNPVIGYESRVTITNISADTEDPSLPVINLANQFTYPAARWQGLVSASYQHVRVDLDVPDLIDYLAVAGHNFGTGEIAVSVEGFSTLDSSGDPDWFELSPEVMPQDNDPILFRFVPQSLGGIRLRLAPGLEAPRAAVLFVGRLLVLERRMYVGHRIVNFNSKTATLVGRSETGQFLGKIVLSEANETVLDLKNMTPSFYRQMLNPFRKYAKTGAFFFAWRPSTYRFEVGYGWGMGDMSVSNQHANGFMQASLNMQGFLDVDA